MNWFKKREYKHFIHKRKNSVFGYMNYTLYKYDVKRDEYLIIAEKQHDRTWRCSHKMFKNF